MKQKYQHLKRRTLYTHPRITLLEDDIVLPDGSKSTYLLYGSPASSVNIFVQDHDGRYLLLNEYTYPLDSYIYQLPGGNVEPGEDVHTAAKRELLEETGLVADSLIPIGSVLIDHRRSTARLYFYLAKELKQTSSQLEPAEHLELHWLTVEQIWQLIRNGKVLHFGTLCGWSYLQAYRKYS